MKKYMIIGCLALSCSFATVVTPFGTESVLAAASKQTVHPTQIKNINEKNIISLIVAAQKHYVYTSSGGKGTGKIESFKIKNDPNAQEYRFLSADIGTPKKLSAYLTQVFTKQASETYIKERFITYQGRTAQLNADGGNLLQFDKATAKLLRSSGNVRDYQLIIPYPADVGMKPEVQIVTVQKEKGVWRIATPPEKLF
ncbi:DL-endopeptidase inhibitor IseA family protein [Aneurinibacillus uraniidurans]|uniref:DL-endopeptidase inhibitor IseA family protein n=1 Tax=Aneurinibacillus uraniidurans TaxID=2966586 RepID=UPI00234A8538|nr:DL-endopeptidase inhibitor IseA family protein [Aneurinibacillus sp. B1]WCN37458.1 DL-endopeptidase inhibitor IseA family protein [Aneurinibacillus sp. B1]